MDAKLVLWELLKALSTYSDAQIDPETEDADPNYLLQHRVAQLMNEFDGLEFEACSACGGEGERIIGPDDIQDYLHRGMCPDCKGAGKRLKAPV